MLVDGSPAIGPDRFSENITTVEHRATLAGGDHEIIVRAASVPGTYIDVSVRAGGSLPRHGLAQNSHLELFNTFAEPAVFSPLLGAVRLSGHGTVVRLSGLPSDKFGHSVFWAFEVRSTGTCSVVRTLRGQSGVEVPSIFLAEAVWDGRDETGAAADGLYV
ncbi:MAG: hypothetical protein HYZ27_03660 [Deltaproteobacteria bacterium]|nr:hypothetical protein [Deltaproteobacteria bacterium]